MDDLDFDAVEALLDSVEGSEKKRSRSRRKRSRSRRRSRDRDRRRREREDRDRSESREKKLAREKEKQAREDERRLVKMEEERQTKVDLARRDDVTVLVMSLHHKADERQVYEYFSQTCGKVRDVQVIRDQRSGKSKGVCYVEFYLPESVYKALACTGQTLMGHPIRVQSSQAEKNRASEAAKIASTTMLDLPMRLYVGGLTDALENITEAELSKLFQPFGEIEFIDLQKDPYTQKCKGYAFLQFKKSTEAKEAMAAMNGFQLAGQEIKVGFATAGLGMPGMGMLENGGAGFAALTGGANGLPAAQLALSSGLPTLKLKNMFDPNDPAVATDPDFFSDVQEDVTEECSKYGPVDRILVDKGSIDGLVLARFTAGAGAQQAQAAMHGRWFAGKQIAAELVSDAAWLEAVATLGP